jgi:hypothetical protein
MRSSPLWEAFIGKRAPNKDATVRYRITTDFMPIVVDNSGYDEDEEDGVYF